jgi:hypothetical protein
MNYFEREVNMDRVFGSAVGYRTLTMPTKANARHWIERIENALSGENLTCDGELRGAPLRAKRKALEAALSQCHGLLGTRTNSSAPDEGAKDGDSFMGFADSFSMRALYNKAKRERTQQRETKLVAAVQAGFRTGARILISNGTTGTIIKVNRTRVKVKGDDGRMWSVPPRCMTLVKGK